MDRPPHDYSAMAFAQQQQQYGFHPQPQQFPPHGPPYMAPHPSLQQYPFPRHLPPQQIHAHHMLHLQQQQPPPMASFPPPHVPPHNMVLPPHFHHPFDTMPPPAPAPPPADPELHKRIDKLAEYSAKNGPEFEAMIREKQQDNPEYAFLFGGEGHGYYRYKLWLITRAPDAPFGAGFGPSSVPMIPPINPMMNSSARSPAHLGASPVGHPGSMMGGPPSHQSYLPSYDQHQLASHGQTYLGHARGDYETPSGPFKGLAGPLPSDVAAELNDVLSNLTGTKESIKGAKMWFMQRSPFAPALAEALKERVFSLDDSEKQLHIVFLANDILFDSLQRRMNPHELDNEALAFKLVLGSMLARIYNNPHNREVNQSRLEKILQFWAAKEVYDPETIQNLEKEMTGGAPLYHSSDAARPLDASGLQQQAAWQPDKHLNSIHGLAEQEPPEKHTTSRFGPPVTANALPGGAVSPANAAPFAGIQSVLQVTAQTPLPQLPTTSATGVGDQQRPPPYPLFPPGLIPGMVRKMQIGSGVPYSPLSPLDIPTVIPPSTVSPSEVLDRVSKFFREIGEVNPSEGPMKSYDSAGTHDDYEHDEYERDLSVRKGGACIPPPPNLQADPETGMYPDGTVERKPGSSSTGRLGLGATADPNEVTQYDDVYNSYRKQRSSSYHSFMSARATTK